MNDADSRQLHMKVIRAAVFATNCTVLSVHGAAVIIDPGALVTQAIAEVLQNEGWQPLAVVLTHGHADHTWDAAAASARLGVPVLVHPGDRYRLEGPFTVSSVPGGPPAHEPDGQLGDAFRHVGLDPRKFDVPAHILEWGSDAAEAVADKIRRVWGCEWQWRHAPGHTEGSTIYLTSDGSQKLANTGDVLFRGSVGRTDLPGGDARAMVDTLGGLRSDIDPATILIPGHGPTSTMAEELVSNPYLRG